MISQGWRIDHNDYYYLKWNKIIIKGTVRSISSDPPLNDDNENLRKVVGKLERKNRENIMRPNFAQFDFFISFVRRLWIKDPFRPFLTIVQKHCFVQPQN